MAALPPDVVRERRNAHTYLVGLAFSLVGNSAMTLVAGIWIKSLTGSSSAAALVSACVYAPSLLGPVAGLVADRVPLRPLLVGTDVAMAALVTTLLLVRSEREAWLIYVVMAAYGMSLVLLDPAESALFTVLFRAERRAAVNGVRLTLQEGGKLVAPLGGAALYVALGGGAVASLDAITFLIGALAVARLRFEAPPPDREPVQWRTALGAGIGFVRRAPELRLVVVLAATAMSVSGVLVAAQFDLVAALHRPPSFLGVLAACLGAGSIAAGLLSGRLIGRFGELGVVTIGLFDAAAGSLLNAIGSTATALAGSFVLGFALPWIVVAAITIAQRVTPSGLQGRVSAALTLALFAPLPLLQALGAALITRFDYRALYLGAAVVQVSVAAVAARRGRLAR